MFLMLGFRTCCLSASFFPVAPACHFEFPNTEMQSLATREVALVYVV